jgi:signal transduction histidine kinase/ActR/RegA family two-component response regulator
MPIFTTGHHTGLASARAGILRGWTGLMMALLPLPALAHPEDDSRKEPPVITDAVRIWELPPAEKQKEQSLRIEGRVSHFDPQWKALWLESGDVGTYVQLADSPPWFQVGQRVRIEGSLVPVKGLSGDSVRVTVLNENEPVTPLNAAGRINDFGPLRGRVVVAEGYVAGQQYVDDEHVRLALIIDDRPVIGWVRPRDPRAVPNWAGKFVRIQGLYSPRFTPTGTETTIELWCDIEEDLVVIGSLADSPIFELPRTPIDQLYQQPVGAKVLVRGTVEDHQSGSFMVIRDGTGQVLVRSMQPERMPFGAEVEAVGRVQTEGAKWVLRQSLYRRSSRGDGAAAAGAKGGRIDSVERIRQLSLEQAAQRRPVRITGLVTWSMPGTGFFFLQDVSGGIRVRFDPEQVEVPQLGKYLEVEGVTYDGGFMPAVDLQSVIDRGSMSPPEGRPVTFEQAISGQEDGQWVAMRGFIQRTESEGDWRWLHVTTPAGDFVGLLQSPVNFVANPGSLIRVHGVCEATADANGQLTGVMLRVPFIHSIVIEEDAPIDYFDLPVRSLKELRRLSGARDLMRVRVSGTALHSVAGRVLYVQDGDTALPLLTRQQQRVAPGERIDAVGVLGWEGTRIVLRETVFRALGRGEPPTPVVVADPSRLQPALDARLVTVEGRLIDVAQQEDHTRLTLQAGSTLFEALLTRAAGEPPVEPELQARLRVTGLYQIGLDESRQARRFTLQLRTPADIAVAHPARLWNLKRALLVAGVLAGATLLGVAWITALRRRVQRQTQQIRRQMERQSRLEAEVHRAARLESLGVLAGGIAHDFNNILTIVMGNLGLVMLDKGLSDASRHCLREIERGTTRARSLTRQLLTFAKGGEPVRAPLQLPEFVKETVLRVLHGSPVRSDYSIASGLWPALVDKDQLSQALQSLVLNAVQAMPGGGLLLVMLSNETIGSTHRTLAPGRYVRVVLADTGEGIPAEVLPRVFDPYFSTRKTGSGLGLATVYSIVKRHSGSIEVESKVGEGTKFTLWLPALDPGAPSAIAAETPEPAEPVSPARVPTVAPAAKSARVLLMDDEPSIQRIVSHVLQRMGLEVVAVSEGATALREFSVAQHKGRPFDLVLLDLTVPGGMGGREVIDLIRKLDQKVPAIVSSGYSDDPVMANFRHYGFQAVVGKPYDVNQLAEVVNQLLTPPAQTGERVT